MPHPLTEFIRIPLGPLCLYVHRCPLEHPPLVLVIHRRNKCQILPTVFNALMVQRSNDGPRVHSHPKFSNLFLRLLFNTVFVANYVKKANMRRMTDCAFVDSIHQVSTNALFCAVFVFYSFLLSYVPLANFTEICFYTRKQVNTDGMSYCSDYVPCNLKEWCYELLRGRVEHIRYP